MAFHLGERTTAHLRHEHKYGHRGVAPERRSYFRVLLVATLQARS